jgi:tetratricopeptide (TPR) repeat protein
MMAGPPADMRAAASAAGFVLGADDVRLLTEVGFLAASHADAVRAKRIFGALAAARPHRAFPSVGLATAWLNAGRPDEAVAVLEQALVEDRDERDTLDSWRGLALQMAGRVDESRRLLQRVADADVPESGRALSDGARLARHLLGEPTAPAHTVPLPPSP